MYLSPVTCLAAGAGVYTVERCGRRVGRGRVRGSHKFQTFRRRCAMERVRFFDHDGHRILLLDCTGCGPDELLEVFEQAKLTIAAEPPHSMLTLADFTGAQFNRKAADQMKVTATYN